MMKLGTLHVEAMCGVSPSNESHRKGYFSTNGVPGFGFVFTRDLAAASVSETSCLLCLFDSLIHTEAVKEEAQVGVRSI